MRTVLFPREVSLGICVAGGTDQMDGPNVYIQDIIVGGDTHTVSCFQRIVHYNYVISNLYKRFLNHEILITEL